MELSHCSLCHWRGQQVAGCGPALHTPLSGSCAIMKVEELLKLVVCSFFKVRNGQYLCAREVVGRPKAVPEQPLNEPNGLNQRFAAYIISCHAINSAYHKCLRCPNNPTLYALKYNGDGECCPKHVRMEGHLRRQGSERGKQQPKLWTLHASVGTRRTCQRQLHRLPRLSTTALDPTSANFAPDESMSGSCQRVTSTVSATPCSATEPHQRHFSWEQRNLHETHGRYCTLLDFW